MNLSGLSLNSVGKVGSCGYRLLLPGPADLSLSSPSPRCVADYYSPAMLGLKTDQEVLAELVRMKLPAVAALMDGHGVLWTLLVSRWFICLFVDILPVEVSTLTNPRSCVGHCGVMGAFLCLYRLCCESGTVCLMKAPKSSSGLL